MKYVLSVLALLALLLAAPLLYHPAPTDDADGTGLPWQASIHADGTVTVFGIRLEHSTLAMIAERYGDDLEVAVMQGRDGRRSLEAYDSRFRSGPVTGKLVLSLAADEALIDRLVEAAGRPAITPAGSVKYPLSLDEPLLRGPLAVLGLTYIPSADIDRETLLKRFGEPGETVDESPGTTHLLYPDIGLDLVHNESGREVLQYTAPRTFASMRGALGPESARPSTE